MAPVKTVLQKKAADERRPFNFSDRSN